MYVGEELGEESGKCKGEELEVQRAFMNDKMISSEHARSLHDMVLISNLWFKDVKKFAKSGMVMQNTTEILLKVCDSIGWKFEDEWKTVKEMYSYNERYWKHGEF